MGFSNDARSSGTTFFSIGDGKVRIRLKEFTEGCTERQLKDGKIVHEFVYDKFEGRLTSLTKEDSPYGTQWRFQFTDGDKSYTLNINYDSSTAMKLLNQLLAPEIDTAKPLTLKPYDFTADNGKRMVGVTVYQNGAKIVGAYGTNGYPVEGRTENMPELKPIKYKGKDTWDSTDRLEFLEGKVSTILVPKLTSAVPTAETVPAHEEGGDDGLPF